MRESAATYQAPLPGSAVLPDMFKAPAKLPGQDLVGGLPGADAYARPVISSGPRRVRSYDPYKLHVFSSRNNTILTLSAVRRSTHPALARSRGPEQDEHEVAVGWVSGGSAGFKGAQRSTYDAGVEVTLQMVKRIREMINPPVLAGGRRPKTMGPAPTEIELVFKGFGAGREAVFRTLMTGDADVVRSLIRRVTDAVCPLSAAVTSFICSDPATVLRRQSPSPVLVPGSGGCASTVLSLSLPRFLELILAPCRV